MSLLLPIAPPKLRLRHAVVVPARNEEAYLPRLVGSLAEQRDFAGRPLRRDVFEVILLLNNCTDGTAEVARGLRRRHPDLRLHVAEVTFRPDEAHVGRARQVLLDTAHGRFAALGRDGLLLTTDADTRVTPTWIASNAAEVLAGADLVGGRVMLEPAERAALPAPVRRFFLLDVAYRRLLERLTALLLPDPSDPYPRHHQHFGASLAVTASAYARAGGMPCVPTSEDVALYRAVREAGGCVRHSPSVRVYTSARFVGRAHGGLADAFQFWAERAASGRPVLVESAKAAEARLSEAARLRREGHEVPEALVRTPEPEAAASVDEIGAAVRGLRLRCHALHHRSPDAPPRRARTYCPRPAQAA